MNTRANESLASGSPSQSGGMGESATDDEKAAAASRSDRVDEAAPQGLDDAEDEHQDILTDGNNDPRADVSRDEVSRSDGEQASIDAGARHSDAKLAAG